MSTTEKKKRNRRNYQKELERLADYCQITIEVLKKMNGNPTNPSDHGRWNDAIAAYEDVLSRLGGK